MSREFVTGDRVYLRAGNGPLMSIRTVYGDYITTRWFDEDQRLQTAEFHPNELVHDDDTTKKLSTAGSRRRNRSRRQSVTTGPTFEISARSYIRAMGPSPPNPVQTSTVSHRAPPRVEPHAPLHPERLWRLVFGLSVSGRASRPALTLAVVLLAPATRANSSLVPHFSTLVAHFSTSLRVTNAAHEATYLAERAAVVQQDDALDDLRAGYRAPLYYILQQLGEAGAAAVRPVIKGRSKKHEDE